MSVREHKLKVGVSGVRGVVGEVLLHRLDARDVAISTGAACHEGKDAHNPVLAAMGLGQDLLRGAIRLSVSRLTTAAEVDQGAAILVELVNELRRTAA